MHTINLNKTRNTWPQKWANQNKTRITDQNIASVLVFFGVNKEAKQSEAKRWPAHKSEVLKCICFVDEVILECLPDRITFIVDFLDGNKKRGLRGLFFFVRESGVEQKELPQTPPMCLEKYSRYEKNFGVCKAKVTATCQL